VQQYIVFGGPLASGKTTLARLLSARLDAEMLLEKVGNHPLIADFYRDPKAYALETELIFTIMHYHDIARVMRRGRFSGNVVSDLFFDGIEAYTSFTLSVDDRKTFLPLFKSLQERVPAPTRVFFLSASTEFLMKRVRNRRRHYEGRMTFEYLDGVNKAFTKFIAGYKRAPVTQLDAEELDHKPPMELVRRLETFLAPRS
jgi:deoxyadenosine/deoxycytidine kinase